MHKNDEISIGLIAARTGISVSAIRFYEAEDLISSTRSPGGQRRFKRSDIRRVSFILIAQQLGFSLDEIRTKLQDLPRGRTPTQSDWSRISRAFRHELDARIETLTQLRDKLDGCIGCGCLSLRKCALYNPQDGAQRLGVGPRYLLGDRPSRDSHRTR
ncbi:MAG: redox-sensitive transcriptional activator SoxR [Hyphomicrobiaceae bacterium]